MLNKTTLIICSNREKINYQNIWNKIIKNKLLSKIILATQGKANNYLNKNPKINHLKLNNHGRSKALNSALINIKTKYVGLTDDDCIIGKNWLSKSIFQLSKTKADLVFGKTLPCNPGKNKNKICPSTFSKSDSKIINKICPHWQYIGFDNNVVIKKEVFNNIGGYKEWLGPGTSAKAAEDAEFIIRSLIAGYKIAYSPEMIVFHDRWLNNAEWEELSRSYILGGIIAYGFYTLQGVKECKPMFFEHISSGFSFIKSDIKKIIFSYKIFFLKTLITDIFLIIKGLLIILFYTLIIPIPYEENVVKRFYR